MSTALVAADDGRNLAVSEYGDPNGQPAIYFHGCPSSRIEAALWHEAAQRHGIRLISFDRPGCGLSDPKPDRTVLDIVNDVETITAHLGIDTFHGIAMSGGMPSLSACAIRIPDRLNRAIDCAGFIQLREVDESFDDMAPGDKLFGAIAVRAPIVLRVPFSIMRLVVRRAGLAGFRRFFASWNSDADKKVLEDPAFAEQIFGVTYESFRQNTQGPCDDALLCFRDWGFDLADITIPFDVHQGLDDLMVAPSFSTHAADTIPGSSLTTYPDTGHYGLMLQAPDRVMASLAQDQAYTRRDV